MPFRRHGSRRPTSHGRKIRARGRESTRCKRALARDQSAGSPMIGLTDLLKQGRLVGDFAGDGVMFAIEIGGEDRYVFRRYGRDGLSEQYYLWYEGCGWAEYDLTPGELQRLSPEFMTLMEIWQVTWQALKDDPVHSTLGALGFIPFFGVVFDGADAIVYVIEGDVLGATLASAAIISSAVVSGLRLPLRWRRTPRKHSKWPSWLMTMYDRWKLCSKASKMARALDEKH